MKTKFLFGFVLALVISMLFFRPTFAMGLTQEIAGLTIMQVSMVGAATTFLVSALRLVADVLVKRKIRIPNIVLEIIVGIVAGFLTWLWFPVEFILFPLIVGGGADALFTWLSAFSAWIEAMFILLSPSYVIASAIYRYIIKKVYNDLGDALGVFGFSAWTPKG